MRTRVSHRHDSENLMEFQYIQLIIVEQETINNKSVPQFNIFCIIVKDCIMNFATFKFNFTFYFRFLCNLGIKEL